MFTVKSIYRLVFFVFFLAIFFLYYILFIPNLLINKKSKRFNIYPKSDITTITEKLFKDKYIKNKFTFKLATYLFRYGKKINPGSYYIKSNSNNWKVIKMFRVGLQKPLKLVLYDINTKKSLIESLCKNLYLNEEEINLLINNNNFLKKFGFNKENILSMFIPNTYEVYWNISPSSLLKKFYLEYLKFWNKERIQKCNSLKLSKILIILNILFIVGVKITISSA